MKLTLNEAKLLAKAILNFSYHEATEEEIPIFKELIARLNTEFGSALWEVA